MGILLSCTGKSKNQKRGNVNDIGVEIKVYPITDDYSITTDVLGSGINGSINLIINKTTNNKFALKRLKNNPDGRREIQLQVKASRDCEHILKIIDVYCNKNLLEVVFEYAAGGDLFDRIDKRSKIKSPFTEQEVRYIFSQIARGVKHMHDLKIAHRDLKPENILLDSTDPANFKIKICDFGFAKDENEMETPCYTESYVSPEVLLVALRRNKCYNISCDIWSLGVLLYVLILFRFPFFSRLGRGILSPSMRNSILNADFRFPINDIFPDRSSELKDLIRNMIVSVPEQRYTIDQVVASEWLNMRDSVGTEEQGNSNIANELPIINLPDIDTIVDEQQEQEHLTSLTEGNDQFTSLLVEMRIDNCEKFLKSLETASNPLYKRRLKK